MKKIVAIILALSMCLCLSISASAETSLTEEEMIEKNRLYHLAIDWFEGVYDASCHGDFYFDNNGDLVLNIVPEKFTSKMKEDLDRCNQVLCKNYLTKNGIRIAEVKYTLDELNLFYNALIAYYKTEGFCCISLDTVSNKISVELPNSLPRPQNIFSSSSVPFDAIRFSYTENSRFVSSEINNINKSEFLDNSISPHAISVSVRPGTMGYSGGLGCTMSWGIKYQGMYCYLYAGHGVEQGNSIFYNEVNIGKAVYKKTSENLDCALIARADSSKTISNILPNGSTLSYSTPKRNYKANDTVWMYGATSARRSGTITSISSGVYTDKGYITDVILASYHGYPGDSGAPIFYSSSEGRTPLGIHSAYSDRNNCSAIIKLHNILDATGGVLYDF